MLNFVMVFLNRPFDSPACEREEQNHKRPNKQIGRDKQGGWARERTRMEEKKKRTRKRKRESSCIDALSVTISYNKIIN